MACGCGKKKVSAVASKETPTVVAATASNTVVAPRKPLPGFEYKPPVQTRPTEYCVVNSGKIISCFDTMDEAKAERLNIGATSVVTRFK